MCGFSACICLPQANSSDKTSLNSENAARDDSHANGYACNGDNSSKSLATRLKASIDQIAHRGPDDYGVWVSGNEQVGLAHARLSINDLSTSGRQPLHSSDQQVHVVVNGEIYDFDRLRDWCKAEFDFQFQSHSDSELVLALYLNLGAPKLFAHLRGEFAFVLHDEREGSKCTIVGRDRYGIKPVVYSTEAVKGTLLVASEAKAFLPMGWKPEWDVDAIVGAGWMFDDRSLFRGVRKVLPGHYMQVTAEHGIQQHQYWDAEYEDKFKYESRTMDEMITGTRERLVDAVKLRLRADVPVGIYLSGGIDSSAIAGIVTNLIREQNVKLGNEDAATRVKCFSVAFPETSGYDESKIAERTAEWLGVETIKKTITEDTLAQDFASTVYHCEHHHFDLNTVAKFALSTLPRENGVPVVLTGEGADEHFAGYPYFPSEYLREADHAMPASALASDEERRQAMHVAVAQEMKTIWRHIGATAWGDSKDARRAAFSAAAATGPGAVAMSDNLLAWHPQATLFASWIKEKYARPSFDLRNTTVVASHSANVQAKMRSRWHPLHTAMYMWNKNSLANVLLSCLGDRTEMAHSVEARTPFLDHHFTEYVNRLPPSVKLHYTPVPEGSNGDSKDLSPIYKDRAGKSALQSLTEKWILREAVRPYITDELYRRKKHPFLAPTKWPRNGALHRMFQSLLSQEAVEKLGFVDYTVIDDAMIRAWGEEADAASFRVLLYCASWVTLGERFGVATAVAHV